MSPLAKKKLLSQVSGASLSSSYPYGSPPLDQQEEWLPGWPCSSLSQAHYGQHWPHGSQPAIGDPARAEFPKQASEERKGISDIFKHDKLSRSEPHRSASPSITLSPLADPHVLKQEIQEGKEKLLEKRALPHSHMPSFLADFYHLLTSTASIGTPNTICTMNRHPSTPRDMWPGNGKQFFPSHKHQEKLHVNYLGASLHLQTKKSAAVEAPTEISQRIWAFPRTSRPTGKALGLAHSAPGPQRARAPPSLQVINSQSRDCHPKACRVSPMTMSAPKISWIASGRESLTLWDWRISGRWKAWSTRDPPPENEPSEHYSCPSSAAWRI